MHLSTVSVSNQAATWKVVADGENEENTLTVDVSHCASRLTCQQLYCKLMSFPIQLEGLHKIMEYFL